MTGGSPRLLVLVVALALAVSGSGGIPRPAAEPVAGPPVAGPLDRFVSETGSDDGPGTADAPWRTLQRAAGAVEPGSTVWVREGRYAGFVLDRSGEPGAPVVIAGWPGDRLPIVDGALGTDLDVIRLSGVHDVTVRGLLVTGAAGGEFSGSGIRVENGSERVAIVGNLVTGNQGFGVIARESRDVLIAANEISHAAAGVYLSRDGAGTVVVGNRIHHIDRMLRNTETPTDDDAGGDAVVLERTTGPLLVVGNRIWGNRARSRDYGWDGGAFSIYGASRTWIVGNVAWDNENVLETGTDSGRSCARNVFLRNVARGGATQGRAYGMFLRCATDMLVAHNTLVDLDFAFSLGPDSEAYSGESDGLTILNNVVDLASSRGKVYGIEGPLPESVRIDHDVVRTTGVLATWPGGSTRNIARFREATGFEANGSSVDPGLVSSFDQRLRAGSAAIDAGTRIPGLSRGAAGAAPDAGAYERREP
jgi:hypothetical protein